MKTRFTSITGCALCLLLLAALLMACQPIRPEGVSAQAAAPSAEEQFMATILAHEEAYQNEDWETFVNFYAEDAISHAPGFPTDAGKAAITTAVQGFLMRMTWNAPFKWLTLKFMATLPPVPAPGRKC